MSGTISRGREAGQRAQAIPAAEAAVPGRRRRGVWVAAGIAVVLAAAAVSAWGAGAFSAAASPGAGQPGAPAPATAAVAREDIDAVTPVAATLGYAGSFTVAGQGGGTLTWLPRPGQVISQGQVLYQTGNGSPVVLLHGTVPDWRAMSEGMTGQDVSQVNHDLVTLGYASGPDIAAGGWDYYSAQTASGVQQLETHLQVSAPSGGLALGQVVFEPEAIRVAQVTGSLGGAASGPVLQATSDQQVVTIALDTAQESQVKAGDAVTVTLPDGTTTPGVVSSVGTVATTTPASQASQPGQSVVATIPVQVTLTNPAAAGTLDQAPVTVNITNSSVKAALVVPVGALLAQSSGGYAVEVTGAANMRHLVRVKVGIFDDTDGLVQVTGPLHPGQRVVVPAT
jgi:hypothetical protein